MRLRLFCIVIFCMIIFSGCSNNVSSINETNSIDLDITEKMYVTYINEIYTNPSAYLGKRVRLEGIYTEEYIEPTQMTYRYVYRSGPGCCGTDGSMCGFEFTMDGEYPSENDWIEVVGTLEQYDENGIKYLNIKADSVTVKSDRGAEVVTQ